MSLVKQENGFHLSPNHQVENKITSIINRYTTVATTNGIFDFIKNFSLRIYHLICLLL